MSPKLFFQHPVWLWLRQRFKNLENLGMLFLVIRQDLARFHPIHRGTAPVSWRKAQSSAASEKAMERKAMVISN